MIPAPLDLNLRHLRALAAIAARGSMSAAADAVSLSQPALTQGLAKLERQIGCALFDRRHKGMAATPQGIVLAGRVDAAFAHLAAGARGGRGFARPEQLMTAAQARAFLALADAGSFVAAAVATGLSQPAIHRAVGDLEQVIGIRLVERRGRGILLNPAGQRVARGIRLAQREIAAGLADMNAAEDIDRIVIGAMPLSRAQLVPAAVATLAGRLPRLRFDIVEGSWRELVSPLRDGVIDIMVGALRPTAEVPDLAQTALLNDRTAIIARAGHPLAKAPTVDGATLAAFPWIVGRGGSPLRAQWEALFDNTPPRAQIECGSVMVMRGLLVRGDFLTLLSPDQVGPELADGLLTQIGPTLTGGGRTIGVATRRDWRPSQAQAAFLAALDAAAGRSLQENE